MAKVRVNWGPTDEDCSVRLYEVWNTSHNNLYILARDKKIAMSVAYTANHIHNMGFARKDRSYPHIEEVRGPRSSELHENWKTIQSAIAQRLEGSVHFDGDHASVGWEAVESR